MEFNTDPRIDEWVREHVMKCRTRAFDGAQFEYTFVPTGITESQEVKCLCCKKKFSICVD